ncbi:hypothetical protein SDC9_64705 [bioreactor metagenome]|uniref:Uncharacterized protein n=1 Tax=bioreactor metagenome TaxID=1076179 RepID=A0A644XQ71_9ZZZZ
MRISDSPVLVSACLLGLRCRYNAEPVTNERVLALAKTHALIPVCPEQLGGLSTPRPPAERLGERVVSNDGTDVTSAFVRGAEETLLLARTLGCKTAILKARSPSCGHGRIYDGSFSGTLIPGSGVTAELLAKNGIRVFTEDELPDQID